MNGKTSEKKKQIKKGSIPERVMRFTCLFKGKRVSKWHLQVLRGYDHPYVLFTYGICQTLEQRIGKKPTVLQHAQRQLWQLHTGVKTYPGQSSNCYQAMSGRTWCVNASDNMWEFVAGNEELQAGTLLWPVLLRLSYTTCFCRTHTAGLFIFANK